ncbi:RluA family pseudouridine synthase [Candidatus Margulisiibacteriota bacterium]
MQFYIEEKKKNQRLDQYLSSEVKGLTRSRVKKLIDSGSVLVNRKKSKASYKLKEKDEIKVSIPKPGKSIISAEKIPLVVIYEDKDIIVISKPRGLVVHPGAGNKAGTLVNALLNHCKDLSGIGGVERPGIVHRLDKDTSGILVVAKNDKAHRSLSRQFQARTVEKTYLAIVAGKPKQDSGSINLPVGRHPVNRKKMMVAARRSREALTNYKVLKVLKDGCLVELKPKTGRTHQLRVHLKHLGHPIIGDVVYGKGGTGQLLHAYKLKFIHPTTQKEMEFTAEMPEDMKLLVI